MKHIIRKAFYDYEKEVDWLNEMSSKGLALTDCSWCRYIFEDSPKDQYIYRIELLDNQLTKLKKSEYIDFLEDSGIECITTYMRWIYLRKKSSDGKFDLYSDIDSRIKHYKRVNTQWALLMVGELFIGINSISLGLANNNTFSIIGGIILLLFGVKFFTLWYSVRSKIKSLIKEQIIRE